MVLKIEKLKQRPVVVLCRNMAWAKQGTQCCKLSVQPQGRVESPLVVMGSSDPVGARTRTQLQQVPALLREAVCSALITLPGRG